MFLDDEALFKLTGYRQKAKQIARLRAQGVPFFVNASGHPVVAEAAITGKSDAPKQSKTWEPTWAGVQARI